MNTVVIGASGGIGRALADVAEARGETVHRLSRRDTALDLAEEDSIAAAAGALPFDAIDRLIVATGVLHDGALQPERALKQLGADTLLRSFLVNAVGPALVLKHFVPRLRREGVSRTALLSARVGSTADNRLGGWYGYRASKAALNSLVRSAAIEVARSRPQAVLIALHPGTVDTAMSQPFQANVPDAQLLTPRRAAEALVEVLDTLSAEDSGGFFDWKGSAIPF